MITDTDVFMIQTLPHNEKHLWVDRQLLQIMHDNWPERISKGKVNCLSRENHPADKSATLRGLNANFLPWVSVTLVLASPVPVFRTVTCAFGITEPLLSFTTPVTIPVSTICASSTEAMKRVIRMAITNMMFRFAEVRNANGATDIICLQDAIDLDRSR